MATSSANVNINLAGASIGSRGFGLSRTATSSGEAKKDFVIRAALNLVNATLTVSL